jgi:putative transposase
MPKKRFSAEQIVTLLRQIEVSMVQGKSAPEACRAAEISQQSYYRWRKEYGGLEIDQAKRMKDLERENVRLTSSGRTNAIIFPLPQYKKFVRQPIVQK